MGNMWALSAALTTILILPGCKGKTPPGEPGVPATPGEESTTGGTQDPFAVLSGRLAAYDKEILAGGNPESLVSNIGGVTRKEASVAAGVSSWGYKYPAIKDRLDMVEKALEAIRSAEKEGQFAKSAGYHGTLIADASFLASFFSAEMQKDLDRVMAAIDAGNYNVTLDQELGTRLGAYSMLYGGLAGIYAERACIFLENGDDGIRKSMTGDLLAYLAQVRAREEQANASAAAVEAGKKMKGSKGKGSRTTAPPAIPAALPPSYTIEIHLLDQIDEFGNPGDTPEQKALFDDLSSFFRKPSS